MDREFPEKLKSILGPRPGNYTLGEVIAILEAEGMSDSVLHFWLEELKVNRRVIDLIRVDLGQARVTH